MNTKKKQPALGTVIFQCLPAVTRYLGFHFNAPGSFRRTSRSTETMAFGTWTIQSHGEGRTEPGCWVTEVAHLLFVVSKSEGMTHPANIYKQYWYYSLWSSYKKKICIQYTWLYKFFSFFDVVRCVFVCFASNFSGSWRPAGRRWASTTGPGGPSKQHVVQCWQDDNLEIFVIQIYTACTNLYKTYCTVIRNTKPCSNSNPQIPLKAELVRRPRRHLSILAEMSWEMLVMDLNAEWRMIIYIKSQHLRPKWTV